jgi:tetratricopeptide (TPR) repeat protein
MASARRRRRGDTADAQVSTDARGREMYSLFLEGDYANALHAAETILAKTPDDPLALAVLAEVKNALADSTAVETEPAILSLDESELVDDDSVLKFDEITTVDSAPMSGVLPKRTDPPTVAVSEADIRPTVRPPNHDEDVLAISWGSAIDTVRVHDQAFDRKRLYETYLASDYRGALALAEELLARRPDDAMAIAIRSECEAAIELRSSVPVAADPEVVAAAELDPKSASLLARVDGVSSVEAIAASSDMPEADALRLVETLLARGLLRLEARTPSFGTQSL